MGGAGWSIKRGFGTREDLSFVEENAQVKGVIPDNVSELAKKHQPMKWVLWVRGIIRSQPFRCYASGS
ncbi:hypothetical protein [Coxiella endosymbiont of Ornithodoros maritimus]|uniref:hypothetical protein n=1 Tax=Coxiella endosymbiont of Ornithodoros maritimus TaxID=1656172 RepID=UPI002264779E|nr:hypothetical protein [Coxiella endosymbiont of Ornithodoros maritimus]